VQKTSLWILIAKSVIGYLSLDSRVLSNIVAALRYLIVFANSIQLPSVVTYSKQISYSKTEMHYVRFYF